MTLTAHAAVGFVVLLLAGLVLFSSIHVRNGERNVWLDSCDPLVGERLTECRALLARLPNGAKFREAELAQNRSLLYGEYLEIFDWLAGLDVKGSVRNPEGKAA